MAVKNFTVTSGTAELSVSATGKGRPIIFLHAGVADKRMWQEQMSALSSNYEVISYDRRGFGATRYAAEAYSSVDDLSAVAAKTTSSPLILIGSSQGGRVAIDYTLAHPENVAALILVAPAIADAPSPENFPPNIQALWDALGKAEDEGDIDLLNRLEAQAWLDGPTSPEKRVSGNIRKLFFDMNGIALRAVPPGDELDASHAYSRLAEIKVPLLLICGDLDFPHVQQRALYIRREIAHAEYAEISNTAHLPNLEQPAQFNRLLHNYLESLEQRPTIK